MNSLDQPIAFTKMSGSGNDFVVIDHRRALLADQQVVPFVRAVCRRGVGIGADGVVLIESAEPGDDVDFRWRYLNADGSDGEMCGNGAMCAGRFALLNGIATSPTRFLTPSGVVTAEIDDPARPQVRITVSDPGPIRREYVAVEERELELFALEVGVPHAVAIVDDAEAVADTSSFHRIGRTVRTHDTFAPTGTNLNVINRIDDRTLRMRTYERGVEAETLACGTGAIASALVGVRQRLVSPPVTVITSSGRPLTVRWSDIGDRATGVWLGGEARVIATGELHPEGWLD
jgi:diaminopimelate epimerase